MKKFSKSIIQFFADRPAIDITVIEKEIGLKPNSISRMIKANKIPEKLVWDFLIILERYGLQIDGTAYQYDKNTETFFLLTFDADTEQKIEEVKTETGTYFRYWIPHFRAIATTKDEL